MSILLLGLDHQHVPLSLMERVAVPVDHTRKVLRELVDLDHVLEAVVVSTCNRVEVYADLSRFHDGYDELVGWFADRAGADREELEQALVVQVDEHAAAHLFGVTSGLHSMVMGEQQIAVQVKAAMEEAREEGTAGRMLQRLFRQAVRVGRRVRRETDINEGARSMVDVGLEAVADHLLTPIEHHRVLVVGAGAVGALTVTQLADAGVSDIAVWNRSEDKAHRLAGKVDGEVVEAGGLVDAVARADVVVCTTGASEPVLGLEEVATAMVAREGRPLVVLDLAVPRNVAPEVATLPGVTVVDVAEVRDVAARGAAAQHVGQASALVWEEADAFRAWLRGIEVEPVVRALRLHAEQVRQDEVERFEGRLASLDDDQRQAVEALTEGIVNTLLHGPTVRLKGLTDGGGFLHARVLAELFGLDHDLPALPEETDEPEAGA